jgi:hypothetical protein
MPRYAAEIEITFTYTGEIEADDEDHAREIVQGESTDLMERWAESTDGETVTILGEVA